MLLEGLKVVELATWIKIEGAAGDPTRAFYPEEADGLGNPIFTMENRGKRSVALDIGRADGRDALLALLREADVFVTNLRPRSLDRAGLDYATVSAEARRLIYASVSGYGLSGPDADLPAFDITAFWSRSGIAAATIPPDQEPFACRPGFGDHITALATLSGVLAALHERATTGRGRLVEAALVRAGTYALGWDLSIEARYGEAVTAQPRDERPQPFAGYFRTRDDRWLCLVPRGPACVTAMLRLIERPELIGDARLTAWPPDLPLVRELRQATDALFAARSFDEAAAMLTAADLIWSPMANLAEVVASDTARHAGCFVELAAPGATVASPAAPARFPEGAPAVHRPAPLLGQHTDDVLARTSAGWPALNGSR